MFSLIAALASLIGSDPKKKSKITKQISTTLSLQIELNEHRKPVSLQLINTDNELDLRRSDESLNRLKDDYRPLSEELNYTQQTSSPMRSSNKIEGNYRGLHKFVARHDDEISIDIGDSIYVIKQEDDLWFKGKKNEIAPYHAFQPLSLSLEQVSIWQRTQPATFQVFTLSIVIIMNYFRQ